LPPEQVTPARLERVPCVTGRVCLRLVPRRRPLCGLHGSGARSRFESLPHDMCHVKVETTFEPLGGCVNQFSRHVALWLVLGLMILFLFNLLTRQQPKLQDISFSNFMGAVERGEVSEVEMEGQNIRGKFHNN